MIIIDTSLWVHQLRRQGDAKKRAKVEELLLAGEAAWCAPIRLEPWRGVGRNEDARVLREYEQVLPEYSVGEEVWQQACQIPHPCRRA